MDVSADSSQEEITHTKGKRMIKLVQDRVAIVPIENPDMIGSLYIPEMAKERLNQGFVKYKGPDVKHLKIGMYVTFSAYSGTLAYFEGEGKLIIMPEEFVTCELSPVKNLPIPGLYFRQRAFDDQVAALYEILGDIMPELDGMAKTDLAEQLVKLGVSSKDTSAFFLANYELAMEYITRAFSEDAEWCDQIKVQNVMPAPSEYDKLGAGTGRKDAGSD
jgi:co-chaperonin GroES (HSP10)